MAGVWHPAMSLGTAEFTGLVRSVCSGSPLGAGAAPWASPQPCHSHTVGSCIQYAPFGFSASLLGKSFPCISPYHGRVVQWILKQCSAFFHLHEPWVCEVVKVFFVLGFVKLHRWQHLHLWDGRRLWGE